MKAKNSKSKQFQILKGLPVWNLVDLYPSISSKKIQTDLNFIRKESKFFEKKYKGKITKLSSLQLYTAITHLEKIDEIIDKILSYAHLLVAENTNEEKNKIFFQQMQEKITNYHSSLIFFGLELNNIEDKKIKLLLKNSRLSKYKTWIL